MIKFSKEKVLLLHRLIAEATGGSMGVRDEALLEYTDDELVRIGLSVADGSMSYEALLGWVIAHRKNS